MNLQSSFPNVVRKKKAGTGFIGSHFFSDYAHCPLPWYWGKARKHSFLRLRDVPSLNNGTQKPHLVGCVWSQKFRRRVSNCIYASLCVIYGRPLMRMKYTPVLRGGNSLSVTSIIYMQTDRRRTNFCFVKLVNH